MGEKRRIQLNHMSEDIGYLREEISNIKSVLQLILELTELLSQIPQCTGFLSGYYDPDLIKTIKLLEEIKINI